MRGPISAFRRVDFERFKEFRFLVRGDKALKHVLGVITLQHVPHDDFESIPIRITALFQFLSDLRKGQKFSVMVCEFSGIGFDPSHSLIGLLSVLFPVGVGGLQLPEDHTKKTGNDNRSKRVYKCSHVKRSDLPRADRQER